MSNLPPPSVLLGIPGKDFWYPGQAEAFDKVMDWYHSPARFLGLSLPTGSGKSVISVLTAKMSGARTVILTATKGLQDQLISDFGSIAVLLKGQNNFPCALVPFLKADEGPCHEGLSCSFSRTGGCAYRVQLQKALAAKIVVTNYAYYLAQTRFSTGLGDVGLLVCDEAHLAFSALESHLTVYLSRMDVQSAGLEFPDAPVTEPPPVRRKTVKKALVAPVAVIEPSDDSNPLETQPEPTAWGLWKDWASLSAPVAAGQVTKLSAEIQELRQSNQPVPGGMSRAYRTAKSVSAKLTSLSDAQGEWIIQRVSHGYVFTPKWVSGYGSALFGTVPKVMLMSAILSHKTADSIGVPRDDNRAWLEVGSYFPPANTPIWHIPTARINYRTDDYGTTIWQTRIDQIIQRRLDRKGIVFTVSYERAKYLLQRSRFKDIMLTHSTADVTQVVNKFKQMPAPAVLVSPSVTTGYDFPAEQFNIRYLILGKVAYPDTSDIITQLRHQDDKDWTSYLAMSTIIQSSGRATRSATDKVECFVIDDNWGWFYHQNKQFAPKWFQERVRGSLTSVPDPLFPVEK